jgi:protein-L-isoaspartate(D-aspartate) O-methyltransferase
MNLVQSLTSEGVLRTPRIIKAFGAIKRRDFVRPFEETSAEEDRALGIGYGQTISQPYTVAFMLELLKLKEGHKVLDVGSGSGWTTALLAHIVGEKGRVYGVEIIPELVAFGQENLAKYFSPNASIEQAGSALGLPGEAPFDRILVSAAAEILPQDLADQLSVDGIMVIPIRNSIVRVTKLSESEIAQEVYEGFVFVPLVENPPS